MPIIRPSTAYLAARMSALFGTKKQQKRQQPKLKRAAKPPKKR
ncbi:MAG: hypothetical protein N3F05_00140 [Candidatus Diapherotrites archaeon]|nr:hypothetical protein [Candidatus Diapherotrites archaeon]